jgi:hypothetical protein
MRGTKAKHLRKLANKYELKIKILKKEYMSWSRPFRHVFFIINDEILRIRKENSIN